jgi:hypothetical protein
MAVLALRWFKAALVLQVLLLAYWLAMEVIDLSPWNDLASKPEGYELDRSIAMNGLQQLAYIGIFALGVRPLAILVAVAYGAFLTMQLWTWWPTYLFGADAAWRETYEVAFSRTLKLLPSYGTHFAPDAQHLMLQLLTLAVVIATAIAAAKMRHL